MLNSFSFYMTKGDEMLRLITLTIVLLTLLFYPTFYPSIISLHMLVNAAVSTFAL